MTAFRSVMLAIAAASCLMFTAKENVAGVITSVALCVFWLYEMERSR